MKKIAIEDLDNIQAGFPWASFAGGALCAAGLITATTGLGIGLAIAGCGSVLLSD